MSNTPAMRDSNLNVGLLPGLGRVLNNTELLPLLRICHDNHSAYKLCTVSQTTHQ